MSDFLIKTSTKESLHVHSDFQRRTCCRLQTAVLASDEEDFVIIIIIITLFKCLVYLALLC